MHIVKYPLEFHQCHKIVLAPATEFTRLKCCLDQVDWFFSSCFLIVNQQWYPEHTHHHLILVFGLSEDRARLWISAVLDWVLIILTSRGWGVMVNTVMAWTQMSKVEMPDYTDCVIHWDNDEGLHWHTENTRSKTELCIRGCGTSVL